MTRKRLRLRFSTTQVIMLSFLAAILLGTLLLMLPISSQKMEWTSFADALFTSTTSVCVTGLVVVPTVSWSIFGQIVILLLIQIGGLGVITVLSGITVFLHRRMGLSDRILLQDAFNLNTLSGLTTFVRRVIVGTLAVEGVGALLYMTVFIPDFGARGVWISVFNAVSAFCNAGMDVFSENSLCDYATHPVINAVTSALIILGGLGYVVWWDVLRVMREAKKTRGRLLSRLTLHSKIVLASTVLLLLIGTAMIFLFERNNPQTIGEMPLGDQLTVSFFQSVTARTAGFITVPQEHLTTPTVAVMILLMFIGGSPVGTAGGVKTVTFAILMAAALSAMRNRREVVLFHRNISEEAVRKSIAVASASFLILFCSTVALSWVTDASLADVLYETASATATVGVSRNLTPTLGTVGKYLVAATMYLGRVGPISLAIAFGIQKEHQDIIHHPTEEVRVG